MGEAQREIRLWVYSYIGSPHGQCWGWSARIEDMPFRMAHDKPYANEGLAARWGRHWLRKAFPGHKVRYYPR